MLSSYGAEKALMARSTGPGAELNRSLSFQRSLFPEREHERQSKLADALQKYATPNKQTVGGLMASNPQLQYSASKAYTSAMKALQDKVRQMERDNDQLTVRARTAEKALEDSQANMQTKLMDEMNRWAENEKSLQKEAVSAQEENRQLKQDLAEIITNREFLMRQVQQLEKEKERHVEQNSVERDQWRRERSQLLSQAAELSDQVQGMGKQKEAMISEVEETKSRLSEIESLLEKSKHETSTETRKLRAENEELKARLRSIKRQSDADLLAAKSVSPDSTHMIGSEDREFRGGTVQASREGGGSSREEHHGQPQADHREPKEGDRTTQGASEPNRKSSRSGTSYGVPNRFPSEPFGDDEEPEDGVEVEIEVPLGVEEGRRGGNLADPGGRH